MRSGCFARLLTFNAVPQQHPEGHEKSMTREGLLFVGTQKDLGSTVAIVAK